ncbi:unnamed protein product [Chondrus crispus]|uniref:Uncharacterized protein n=1 Tax=Chondrus crispus TaxID=2769 RepID=R7Q8E8_CHOCR|nr:unnamed protein product [Chondrus crispus]CDF34309.1 unnamed protein product [Chondrus crispus]|eukprot:XP_005714128.1 unnamed protein product [Chondrus crispus]
MTAARPLLRAPQARGDRRRSPCGEAFRGSKAAHKTAARTVKYTPAGAVQWQCNLRVRPCRAYFRL